MKELDISAKTVEEATKLALQEMGARRDQIEIEIQSEGKSGILGIGAEDAHIRVKLIEKDINTPLQSDSVALEVLQNILNRLELSAEIAYEETVPVADEDDLTNSPMVLDISGEDLGILIGRRGQTLAALQYIVRLIVAQKLGSSISLVLDVNGYKKRRYESLRTLAQHVAEQVTVSHRAFALEPMPAYERRIIHMALADHHTVTTQSAGFGEARKVVVIPVEKNR
jgi:spoIIIJ-associated protein